jgi:hypothetical protein
MKLQEPFLYKNLEEPFLYIHKPYSWKDKVLDRCIYMPFTIILCSPIIVYELIMEKIEHKHLSKQKEKRE